eukprot:Hpha_TRINITY_DN1801_c0_g1::TRINITY_DN1801_c0_g1_i1::g.170525::m.170525
MLAPLGPHVTNPRQRPAARVQAPASTYIANVWVYTDAVSDAARWCIRVRIPHTATVDQAMSLCWSHYRTVQAGCGTVTSGGGGRGVRAAANIASASDGTPVNVLPDPERPGSQYVLLQAYADGRVDPTQPFLHRLYPLSPQLDFPYMLALCPDPFILRLNALERREEDRRAAITRAAHTFKEWTASYSALLRNIVCVTHGLRRQELDEYNRLKRRERNDYFAVRERELWKLAREVGAQCASDEAAEREFLRRLMLLQRECIDGAERLSEEQRRQAEMLRAQAAMRLAQLLALAALREKCMQILREGVMLFAWTARQKRMLYADSTLAQNLQEAQSRGVTPHAQRELRREYTRTELQLRRAEEGGPPREPTDLVDLDCILGDMYTSSWLSSRILEPCCGGVTTLRRRLSVSSLIEPPLLWHSHANETDTSTVASNTDKQPAGDRVLRVMNEVAARKLYLAPGRQRSTALYVGGELASLLSTRTG